MGAEEVACTTVGLCNYDAGIFNQLQPSKLKSESWASISEIIT